MHERGEERSDKSLLTRRGRRHNFVGLFITGRSSSHSWRQVNCEDSHLLMKRWNSSHRCPSLCNLSLAVASSLLFPFLGVWPLALSRKWHVQHVKLSHDPNNQCAHAASGKVARRASPDACSRHVLQCNHFKHITGSKERLFIRTQTHSLQTSGVIHFVKLRNDT